MTSIENLELKVGEDMQQSGRLFAAARAEASKATRANGDVVAGQRIADVEGHE